jgi:hypothetical protein
VSARRAFDQGSYERGVHQAVFPLMARRAADGGLLCATEWLQGLREQQIYDWTPDRSVCCSTQRLARQVHDSA